MWSAVSTFKIDGDIKEICLNNSYFTFLKYSTHVMNDLLRHLFVS